MIKEEECIESNKEEEEVMEEEWRGFFLEYLRGVEDCGVEEEVTEEQSEERVRDRE